MKNSTFTAIRILMRRTYCLIILFTLFLSCSTDEIYDPLNTANLSKTGAMFMRNIKTHKAWDKDWDKLCEVGIPMPNDAILAQFSNQSLYSIIPIISRNKEIKGFAFYRHDANDCANGAINVRNTPEIITKDLINDDLKSRIFIKSKSFAAWIDKGYKLNVSLDDYPSKIAQRFVTKSYEDNLFPFSVVITYVYSSFADIVRVMDEGHYAIMNAGNYMPIRCTDVTHDPTNTEIYYLRTTGTPAKVIAHEFFNIVSKFCSLINGALSVEVICYRFDFWDVGGGGGGSGSGGGGGDEQDKPKEECSHARCEVCGLYLNKTKEASICDSHNYCPTNGNCQITVSLTSTKSTAFLGEYFNLSTTIYPSTVVCNEIAYYITDSKGREYQLKSLSADSKTYRTRARLPGDFKLSVKITTDNAYNKVTSNYIYVTYLCPTVGELENCSAFTGVPNLLWNKTLAATDSQGMQEFGGVLIMTMTDDDGPPRYQFIEKVGAKVPYSNEGANVILDYYNKDYGDPDMGGHFMVMTFHTHPPLNRYKGEGVLFRTPGPSSLDINDKIPSIVYDFDASIHESTDKVLPALKKYYYGPERATIEF